MKLPLGYRYSALYAGIRKVTKADLALIVSDTPAAAAAVFTTNLVQAAPVRLARNNLEASGGIVRAVLVNAGNANCATRTGDRVALATTKALAKELRCPASHVFPASTGVIGVEMEANKIVEAAPELVQGLSADGFDAAADAILTTDLVRKTASTEVGGIRILDDSYNAAPVSVLAALEVLRPMPGRRVAVLGDMLELGTYSEEGHRQVGRALPQAADLAICVGVRARFIAEEALEAMHADSVVRLDSADEAVRAVPALLRPGDVVLVKGSRGMRLERLCQALAVGVA